MQYLVINCKTGKIELNIKNLRNPKEKLAAIDYDFLLLGVISKATATFSAEKPVGGVGQAQAINMKNVPSEDEEVQESALAEPIAESAAKEEDTPDIKLTFIVAGIETKDQE